MKTKTVYWYVVMFTKDNRKVYMSFNGRIKWSKRTAEKHLNDVSNSEMYKEHYVRFELEAEF